MSEPTETETEPQQYVEKLHTMQHAVKVPKGWLQVLVEDGEATLTQAQLVSLLRWTADSLAGERVPMDYKLGDEWNDETRCDFQAEAELEMRRVDAGLDE